MDSKSKLERFLSWFQSLNEADQDELMQLVYSEHKIKDVVRTFRPCLRTRGKLFSSG